MPAATQPPAPPPKLTALNLILIVLLLACLGWQAVFIAFFGGHVGRSDAAAHVLSTFRGFGVEPSLYLRFVLALIALKAAWLLPLAQLALGLWGILHSQTTTKVLLGLSLLIALALWGAVYNPWTMMRMGTV